MSDLHIRPCDCNSKEEIRTQIDKIDLELIKLFALRYDFVKEIVKYKEKTLVEIVAEDRKKQVIEQRSEWAEKLGLDKETYANIFRFLLEHNISKEIEIARNYNTKK